MNSISMNPSKITGEHLQRRAVVYVRQSSEHQVKHNLESQRLQYGLVDRARALGWHDVDVVDVDLGVSAGVGSVRAGFDRVLAGVARGEVGIVFAREVSRLSRNDRDFCRLIELCQAFGTLLGDADQVYDPAQMDDQLVLGIKGTLSVVEMRVLRMRLLQGAANKAKRGELRVFLPAGFVRDDDDSVIFDPDERVRHAIAYVFEVFQQTASIRQTMLRLHAEGVELPVRKTTGRRGQLDWHLPRSSQVGSMLHNPSYAGAYCWGRVQTKQNFQDGRLQKRHVRMLDVEKSRVLLWDHHPGYITRAQYEEHQRMMARNYTQFGGGSPVRQGRALLTGLLRCGRCGRRLQVKFWNAAGCPGRYLCDGTHTSGGKYCLGVSGAAMDKAIDAEMLRVLSPLGIEASKAALASTGEAQVGQRNALILQEQQLQYEVRIAQERYEQVDARNRLVASSLEARWNAKLEELAQARATLTNLDQTALPVSTVNLQQEIQWLGENFEAVWNSEHCPIA